MRTFRSMTISAVTAALAACATNAPPVMPGTVNAPPPPLAAVGDALLTGTVWRWTETVAGNNSVKPDAPDRYTLEFQPGGMVAVRADCNRGSGGYLLNGDALTISPLAMTRAMCPPGSKDSDFLRDLAAVQGQQFRGDDLVLTLKAGAGSMIFATTRQ